MNFSAWRKAATRFGRFIANDMQPAGQSLACETGGAHFFSPAASFASRSALSRSVLARSASRSALYWAMALAPSVAR